MVEQHLWGPEHSYYCSEGNYHSNEWTFRFDSFADFLDAWAGADLDYNLLFRWDWKLDQNELQLCYVLQRKGCYACCLVRVSPADETAVREFLQPRLEHLLALWAPLGGGR